MEWTGLSIVLVLVYVQEAAHLGAKVAVFDYVVPTPQGTKWGAL